MSSSENSSEEAAQHQQEVEDESGGSKVRCYECTFCKRGFTNAQALGGHMNIHRKDRAKAKQVTGLTPNSASSQQNKLVSNNNIEDSLLASPFVSEISGQYQYYSIVEAHRNYNMYFQPSSTPNPRNPPPPHASSYDYLNPRSHSHHHQSLDMNQDLLGANLSLQIGPSSHVESNQVLRRPGIQKDSELDLELRLGHHHPY